jgi:Tfp pilus assembly protein PilF
MQLIALLKDQPHIRIWDLRAVRHRLAELNLDWSPSPTRGSAVPSILNFQLPPPPKYRVDRGQFDQWIKLASIKLREQTVADAEVHFKQQPDQAEVRDWLASACNNLAWELVARPESDRDQSRAVPLARRAVALAADSDKFLNTLGLALYRAGQHAEAIPALERSLARNNIASVPYDLLFLALCHTKHGDAGRARAYFDRALSWLKTNSKLSAHMDEELRAFRAEAEAVLRAAFGDLPDDVFAKAPGTG